jgi:hypothetical protein
MTQPERLARREALRQTISKLETLVSDLRGEESRLLEGCEHAYADGRRAAAGGRTKVCTLCGRLLRGRDDKLWG